jgi:hypothetical protein
MGPQTDPMQVVNVGVAAHITAASEGGPRFDPALSISERTGVANGIWLCQTCAKLIDSDVVRFSKDVLLGWKRAAAEEAKIRIGKTKRISPNANRKAETELRRIHKLRDDLHKAMLKSNTERLKRPPGQSRPWKFAEGEFIVHKLGDTLYPDFDDGQGISNWFKLEAFDFYHNGIEGILDIQYALVAEFSRQWASLKNNEDERSFPTGFRIAKVFKTGKIPWRNIRHFDLRGDDFYPCPHLYCLYDDDGMPYEEFGYYLIPDDDSYEFELPLADRVDLKVLLESLTKASEPEET